ncbi:Rhodanese-like domain-containing protein [Obelidium mucronatum]
MSTAKPLQPEELASWLQDGSLTANEDYLIVDVRGDDFKEGHIASAINIPSTEFTAEKALISEKDQERLSKAKKVVFHCQLSQVRGPTSANNYLNTVGAAEGQEVFVLQGGFTKWLETYGKEKALVEDVKDAPKAAE